MLIGRRTVQAACNTVSAAYTATTGVLCIYNAARMQQCRWCRDLASSGASTPGLGRCPAKQNLQAGQLFCRMTMAPLPCTETDTVRCSMSVGCRLTWSLTPLMQCCPTFPLLLPAYLLTGLF